MLPTWTSLDLLGTYLLRRAWTWWKCSFSGVLKLARFESDVLGLVRLEPIHLELARAWLDMVDIFVLELSHLKLACTCSSLSPRTFSGSLNLPRGLWIPPSNKYHYDESIYIRLPHYHAIVSEVRPHIPYYPSNDNFSSELAVFAISPRSFSTISLQSYKTLK